MALSKNQMYSLGVFIILSLVIIILFIETTVSQQTLNFLTVYGVFASIYGICITYIQIKSVKETNSVTQRAIVSTLIKINQNISIADLSKAIKTTHEIQSYIILEKYEIALLRMRDLKFILIQAKYNEDLKESEQTGRFGKLITDLGINIININDFLFGKKTNISFSKINENLIDLETILSEFESTLKFITHDT